MSQQFFLVERGGVVYALPQELVTGVERFTNSLVRLDLALGASLEVERISMPIEAPGESARRLSPGMERALPGALGVLRLPQGLVLAVEPSFFHDAPSPKRTPRLEALTELRGGGTGANGEAMVLRLAGTDARLLLPAAQVLEVVPRPEAIQLEKEREGLSALMEWRGRIVPVFGFAPPERVAVVRGTVSADPCALVIEDRVERVRWPLAQIHRAVGDFVPPLPVRGAFGYQGQPLLIPDVDVMAA